MTITAAQFPARPTRQPESLCIGYMVQTFETETMYARQDGKIFKSETVARPNMHFDKPGRKWEEVSEIPGDAEFIGNYAKVKA